MHHLLTLLIAPQLRIEVEIDVSDAIRFIFSILISTSWLRRGPIDGLCRVPFRF